MLKIAVFIVIAVALVGLLFVSQQKSGTLVVSGFVAADEIRVGSRVGGRVLKVLVEEGTSVCAGATLVELEPFDLLERRAEAQQLLAQAAATYDKVAAGFRVGEVAQARARRTQIQAELDKLRVLTAGGQSQQRSQLVFVRFLQREKNFGNGQNGP
jgi:HlyD family secretion protein